MSRNYDYEVHVRRKDGGEVDEDKVWEELCEWFENMDRDDSYLTELDDGEGGVAAGYQHMVHGSTVLYGGQTPTAVHEALCKDLPDYAVHTKWLCTEQTDWDYELEPTCQEKSDA